MPVSNNPSALYGAVGSLYGNIVLGQSLLTPFRYGAWQTKSGWPEEEYAEERFYKPPVEKQENSAPVVSAPIDLYALEKQNTISQMLRNIEARDAMKLMNLRIQEPEKESRGQRKKRHNDDNDAYFQLMN